MDVRISPEVRLTLKGKTHVGYYSVAAGLVIVVSEFGVRSLALGTEPPERVAQLIMSKIVGSPD
jgi:hypothetical protein